MAYLFWFSVAFLAYTFVGYPLFLWLFSLFRNRVHQKATIWPTVSVIVAAHNEAAVIGNKLKNCLELDYPKDRKEIIIASDGSNDGTNDIVRSFAEQGVKLVEVPERKGKHYAQMVARDAARGEILVFTDAAVQLERDALQQMVSNFADQSVGCVSSEDRIAQEKNGRRGEALYVRIEMWLRRLEARVKTLVGASGSFFSVRRELCEPWHPEQSSDFFLVLHAVSRGMRAVVDPESRASYKVSRANRIELQRKVRTIVHGLDVLYTHRSLLNPFRHSLFSWQLVSHKLFRWLTPFGFFSLFVSNLFLWDLGLFYVVTLVLQAILYGCGLLALALSLPKRIKLFELAGFFLLSNAATVIGWWKFFLGEKLASWQPTQRG